VPTALNDLCPGVTKIFRTSPIEAWRQVRSGRRLALGERSPESAGLSHNVIDAGAGLQIYRGHAYPDEYRGNSFIGCSQNNLVHRRKLTQDGATFRSERAEPDTEFVRTVDTWFRPVNAINAPDGTLYILDMSREVIESIHIAHDVVAHLDLTSGRDKGRIYRLAPPGFQPPKQPRLGAATTEELAGYLEHQSGWWRDTASRLIYERQDRSVVPQLRNRLAESPFDVGRMHILWALDGLDALEESDLLAGLEDASPGVREHALRLAEPRLEKHPALVERMLALADDPAQRVRFQAAFTLGETDDSRAMAALAKIAKRDHGDSWIRTAVLSSCATNAGQLAAVLLTDSSFLAQPTANIWLGELATIVGARSKDDEASRLLDGAAALPHESPAPLSVVLGLGKGLQRNGHALDAITTALSNDSAVLVERLLREADRSARNSQAEASVRRQAVQLLGYAGADTIIDTMLELVVPGADESVQLAALAVLARCREPRVGERLAEVCRNETPRVQSEIISLLASRPEWIAPLLSACERGDVVSGVIPQPTQTALLKSEDVAIRQRAERLFGAASPRAEVIARYSTATQLTGDAAHGNAVFERECVACHRLGERGNEVGPNLALVRNRTPEAMVEAILDPNRSVAPNYVSYVVVDDSGRTTTGLITSETAASITLARDKGVTETIQKQNIEAMKSTGTSLMPEGLEKTIDPQSMADLLAFLQSVQYDIGTLPDFAAPKK
jgi:putative heme-binding domain-containing protein